MKQTLSNFAQNHPEVASAIHTFLSTFVSSVVLQLSLVPQSNILSASMWTWAFIIGILGTALRAGLKAVSPFVSQSLS